MRTILETGRLRLREMTEADAEHLYRLNLNPNVTRYVGEPALASVAEALEVVRTRILPQYRDHGVGRWAVEAKEGATFLGWCGLKYLDETREYDLGYRFFEAHWGRGYATEAAAATLAWGRRELPGARIVAWADVDNRASLRVLQKLGLRFVAHAQEHDRTTAIYVADDPPPPTGGGASS